MARLTIRKLEDSIEAKLRMCAGSQARSIEDEARCILRAVLGQKEAVGECRVESRRRWLP
jgi:plasmid stability protein